MGLPLFVAPVESDLPSKAAAKSSATSPPRSSIRRNIRTERIERRAAHRRIFSIRDRLNDGSLQQSSTLTGRDGRSVPWAEAGFPPDLETTRGPDGLRRARPFRDVLREMARSDERRRGMLEERINSLFRDGSNTQDRSNTNSQPPYDDWDLGWHEDPRPRPAVIVPLAAHPGRASEENRAQPQRLPSAVTHPVFTTDDSEEMNQRRAHRSAMREALRASNRVTRFAPMQRVDGLGDRDRSLSPEVWDTLLSTLTPDPQPPSAGSSFASNVASQSAGATSGTSFTTPDQDPDALADQACESGCEGSETEDIDQTLSVLDQIRRRRAERRRVHVRLPEAGQDAPIDGGALRDEGAVGSDSRQRRSPDGLVPSNNSQRLRALRRERSLRSRSAWVGHLSVGNSDDEQGPERNRQNRESSTASGSNANVEDDWMGMQRIVRSLARREDIPDEWWAEAGLSRTLPGDGAE
ncbi:hypothetical protein FVEG_03110 [Fusarium verticillioides 7600]|uniref:Uncharacterized protein n=1 Tax=Gibberella moniliformis (strain M3125 / FGSC 7600) TaxID=334819 RepID=W7LZW3_GIBM7|nr:hypothetical protein FVEG_03110 [Fusarium verticillioides 7600]EWG40860.1 hypothetical protein FVEG_03110 [Fusarium verticillioides 7600]RBQ67580.1 hypothetical protein FVER14953_03110 [Fusarium verticillioides]RBQ94184.1 hypothetical protein FVER53263_03110 [Fusarium verticillioides]RBR14871.1 hypothetical protein FVER53590_03110 [Fusarium verticillioides]